MLSCEPCRRKKCKCDRKLPHCSQCFSEPAGCQYAASSKRGLPNGYLNKLEQRLADTELALYETLAELSEYTNSQTSPLNLRTASTTVDMTGSLGNKSKASRMREWEDFPLQRRQELDQWWLAKSQEFSARRPGPGVSGTTGCPPNGESGEDSVVAESEPNPLEMENTFGGNDNQVDNMSRLQRPRPTHSIYPDTRPWAPRGPIPGRQGIQGSLNARSCEFSNSTPLPTRRAIDPVASSAPERRTQTERASIRPTLEDGYAGREGRVEPLYSADQLSKSKWQTYF